MSGPKRRLSVSLAQAIYLHELVKDDMEVTELTVSEQQQARALKRKLSELIHEWWPESKFDPGSTGQDQGGWQKR